MVLKEKQTNKTDCQAAVQTSTSFGRKHYGEKEGGIYLKKGFYMSLNFL